MVLRYYKYNYFFHLGGGFDRKENLRRIEKLHNSKEGKRCFIIGNGPSLRVEDLEKLKDEETFAANSIFKVFDKTDWRPTYYVVQDEYYDVNNSIINSLGARLLFFGDAFQRRMKFTNNNILVIRGRYYLDQNKHRVSDDISKWYVNAPTVTFTTMQIAAYMGYKEIYLLGVDCDYRYIIENSKVVDRGEKKAHFYIDNNPRAVVTDEKGQINCYTAFKKYADSHDIVVKNATRGGKLEVFERVVFDKLLS